jgi:protein-tyrosine phosphatase
MITQIHWINEDKIGEKRIGTMARPRGNDWLEDEIRGLKSRKVDCLVSLLERSEEWELGLKEEGEICQKWGLDFIKFPIEDVNTPENETEFIRLAHDLANRIQENEKVVIHCRMGIGRSSILAASVMIILGCEGSAVFEIISQYRGLQVPDTEGQKNWILSIEEKLKSK